MNEQNKSEEQVNVSNDMLNKEQKRRTRQEHTDT